MEGPPVSEQQAKNKSKFNEQLFSIPRRVLPVPGILQATEDPPGCPQVMPCELPLPQYLCPKKVSEDCLYLNVFTPRNATVRIIVQLQCEVTV